jgi:DNA-binding transcriptional MerR regulator
MEFAAQGRRRRVDRREAAKILQCSRDNVRWMDKNGHLRSSKRDRNGVFTYDRSEIEELARKRGLSVKPTGALTARVFRLFEAKRTFQQICIETEQEADVIQALWERYEAGFDYGKKRHESSEEERRQREHDDEMRAMDRELERRRRGVLFEERRDGPGVANAQAPPFAAAAGSRRAR